MMKNNRPKVLGGVGKLGSTNQYHQQDRIYDNNIAIAVTTAFNPFYAISSGGGRTWKTMKI